MKNFLCKVERVDYIQAGGTAIEPRITADYTRGVKIGDELLLIRPDGSEVSTSVFGIPLGMHGAGGSVPIKVGPDIPPSSIPLGTLVYHIVSGVD